MANRLARETSPYLLQHAENPVDWYPWCEEALALARRENRPVLLSVGYSACHWCHVMAHESFEDDAIADLMNTLYVNIKVDREERPDIDAIYQTAHQLLTRRPGGWPLTVFIDPDDQRPFFAGTYFPREARHGMPGFGDVLSRVAAYYGEKRGEVRAQGDELVRIFRSLDPQTSGHDLTAEPIDRAREEIAARIDRDNGGIGSAPKFPHPSTFERLLRHWRNTASGPSPDLDALQIVSLTLTRMAEGGIYDHLGGGFCRYAIDAGWQIPHFEKMLYDNGALLALYAQAALATGEPLFRQVAGRTADWLLADMQSGNGGFYSSRDADSEGEEGRYYVWTPAEVDGVLPAADAAVFKARFGLDDDPNFEGRWHLAVRRSVDSIARQVSMNRAEVAECIERSRRLLLAERSKRNPPLRDEKQLTSWNALAIRGLAIAGRVLDRPELIDAAAAAFSVVRRQLVVDQRLRASFKDGRARFSAYLDDHAFLLDAALELLQARWLTADLEFAAWLADCLLERFQDADGGGFHFTASDHETLMHRTKPLADDAMPSGNGIAALALQRLGHVLGEDRYLAAAAATLRCAWQAMSEYPHGHVSLVSALEEYLLHPEVIVIRGPGDDVLAWQRQIASIYAPRRLVFGIADTCADLPGALARREALPGRTVAYRCIGTQCSMPITRWSDLAELLSESREDKFNEPDVAP